MKHFESYHRDFVLHAFWGAQPVQCCQRIRIRDVVVWSQMVDESCCRVECRLQMAAAKTTLRMLVINLPHTCSVEWSYMFAWRLNIKTDAYSYCKNYKTSNKADLQAKHSFIWSIGDTASLEIYPGKVSCIFLQFYSSFLLICACGGLALCDGDIVMFAVHSLMVLRSLSTRSTSVLLSASSSSSSTHYGLDEYASRTYLPAASLTTCWRYTVFQLYFSN